MSVILGVGIDCVEISRFDIFLNNKEHVFLKKVFFLEELKYCFSHTNPSIHLAGMFAAKEAVSKALGTDKFPFIEIEIKHQKNGAPVVYKNDKELLVKISITHTETIACAIAVA